MKIKTQWLLVGIAAVFLCWIGWRSQAQISVPDSWEYRVVPTPRASGFDMKELGAQGWELVTIQREEKTFGHSIQQTDYLYFKRKR
jgi:hypothetical protein